MLKITLAKGYQRCQPRGKENAVWQNTTYQSPHSLTPSLAELFAGRAGIAVPLGVKKDFAGLQQDWQFTNCRRVHFD